jgi:hypothetical protein
LRETAAVPLMIHAVTIATKAVILQGIVRIRVTATTDTAALILIYVSLATKVDIYHEIARSRLNHATTVAKWDT